MAPRTIKLVEKSLPQPPLQGTQNTKACQQLILLLFTLRTSVAYTGPAQKDKICNFGFPITATNTKSYFTAQCSLHNCQKLKPGEVTK